MGFFLLFVHPLRVEYAPAVHSITYQNDSARGCRPDQRSSKLDQKSPTRRTRPHEAIAPRRPLEIPATVSGGEQRPPFALPMAAGCLGWRHCSVDCSVSEIVSKIVFAQMMIGHCHCWLAKHLRERLMLVNRPQVHSQAVLTRQHLCV